MQENNEGMALLDEGRYRVLGLVNSRNRNGRAMYTKSGKAALVEMVRSSEVSLPVLARINGVNANLLGKWVHGWKDKRQAKASARKASVPTLIPVKLSPSSTVQCAPARLSSVTSTAIEVVMARGTLRISAADASLLRGLVDALSAS